MEEPKENEPLPEQIAWFAPWRWSWESLWDLFCVLSLIAVVALSLLLAALTTPKGGSTF